jgi:hypothetical protein
VNEQNPIDLGALLRQTVKAIVPQLPELTDAQLAELQATEQGAGNPRESLLHAIEAAIAGRGASASEPPADPPDWLDPDYRGCLTADQAQARIARLGHYHTKPAEAPETK